MSEVERFRGRVKIVLRDSKPLWKLHCPGCGLWADLDDDQLHGRVSTDCPGEGCTFHETHDYTQFIPQEPSDA